MGNRLTRPNLPGSATRRRGLQEAGALRDVARLAAELADLLIGPLRTLIGWAGLDKRMHAQPTSQWLTHLLESTPHPASSHLSTFGLVRGEAA